MGWVHDTGYEPAYDHEGCTLTVLDDGTETGSWPLPEGRTVTGWRAGCECGWRGATVYPQSDWPDASPRGWPPDEVDGWGTGTGCYAEWDEHLHAVLPELVVHDQAQLAETESSRLDSAVGLARTFGASWAAIGRAVGISRQSAHERWGGLAARQRDTGAEQIHQSVDQAVRSSHARLLRVTADALDAAGPPDPSTWLRQRADALAFGQQSI